MTCPKFEEHLAPFIVAVLGTVRYHVTAYVDSYDTICLLQFVLSQTLKKTF